MKLIHKNIRNVMIIMIVHRNIITNRNSNSNTNSDVHSFRGAPWLDSYGFPLKFNEIWPWSSMARFLWFHIEV